ncbi:MAG TPA: hypothetical protein VMX96_04385 [Dehalococcoidia bacterium]|nr:hypothetical protein [Dehalococcoidia bacterium]
MCPSEDQIFDSILEGAVDEYEAQEHKNFWIRAGRLCVGLILFIPRLLFVLITAPIKRIRNRC